MNKRREVLRRLLHDYYDDYDDYDDDDEDEDEDEDEEHETATTTQATNQQHFCQPPLPTTSANHLCQPAPPLLPPPSRIVSLSCSAWGRGWLSEEEKREENVGVAGSQSMTKGGLQEEKEKEVEVEVETKARSVVVEISLGQNTFRTPNNILHTLELLSFVQAPFLL
ncbi:hypothetical protein M0802_010020 [Mischocyttarus mexicanus]|nr:hypothetical protein M0802_010020 [Mischocyttarus mexicanus]